MFKSGECVLARDPDGVERLRDMVREALGVGVQVIAVLEIGSFAKDEAVPTSDIDARIYVESADHCFNNFLPQEKPPPSFEAFHSGSGNRRQKFLDWSSFNEPLNSWATKTLGTALTVVVADAGYVNFLLKRAAEYPGSEHSLIFQSNCLYDPQRFVAEKRKTYDGLIIPELVDFYQSAVRSRLRRMPTFCAPHPADKAKLEESGQILWVAHAVRCIRDAVATKSYSETGQYIYRKNDVLDYISGRHFEHLGLCKQLYIWKTDPVVREMLVQEFQVDPQPLYHQFQDLIPALEEAVETVLIR